MSAGSAPGPEEPFKIHVSDAELDLLKQKLTLTRFPDELEDAEWEYGVPLADIKRLVARWKDGFDWRKSEERINAELPQFTRDISVEGHGSLNVHYVHKRSELEEAVPLLFIHGWPGSFLEVRKILPLLTVASPDHPSFHVVAFSLPGYGFSEAPKKKGFGLPQHAELANALMKSLGYTQYVIQGGDLGHHIAAYATHAYAPENVRGWLSNFPCAAPLELARTPLLYLAHQLTPTTERERAGAAATARFKHDGISYWLMHVTRPQTIGYALADSPVGLLAWVYEKLVDWSEGYPWTDDEVLEWISVHWHSRAGPAAALRIYKEATGARIHHPDRDVACHAVPFGLARFPKELEQMPRRQMQALGRLVYEREHERGGHFAAHEQPAALVDDLRAMFGRGGPAYGVVEGCSGYASS